MNGRLEVVVLVGLQGAGKSSFYRARFAGTHAHVSRDLFPNNPRPSRRQRTLIVEALRAGRPVVVDNTNASVADRAAILEVARAHGARAVAYWFPPDPAVSLRRNAGRDGRARVPRVAIFTTRKRLVPPARAEGFAEVYEVATPEGGGELAFEVRRIG